MSDLNDYANEPGDREHCDLCGARFEQGDPAFVLAGGHIVGEARDWEPAPDFEGRQYACRACIHGDDDRGEMEEVDMTNGLVWTAPNPVHDAKITDIVLEQDQPGGSIEVELTVVARADGDVDRLVLPQGITLATNMTSRQHDEWDYMVQDGTVEDLDDLLGDGGVELDMDVDGSADLSATAPPTTPASTGTYSGTLAGGAPSVYDTVRFQTPPDDSPITGPVDPIDALDALDYEDHDVKVRQRGTGGQFQVRLDGEWVTLPADRVHALIRSDAFTLEDGEFHTNYGPDMVDDDPQDVRLLAETMADVQSVLRTRKLEAAIRELERGVAHELASRLHEMGVIDRDPTALLEEMDDA